MSEENIKVSEDIKKLVIARIDAKMPSNLKMSIGNSPSLSKEEMIEHVKKGDEKGKQIIEMHMHFIQTVASGEFTKLISSV